MNIEHSVRVVVYSP